MDGYTTTLTKIKMPMMFADRSIINVYYPKDNRDGSYTSITSSMDTENVVATHRDRIGKDVLMSNYLNYVHLKECTLVKGPACQWTSITAHELEGYASAELKKKVLGRMIKQPENLISFILTGKKPAFQE